MEASGPSNVNTVDVPASQLRYNLRSTGEVNKGELSLTSVGLDPHHCAILPTAAVQPYHRPTLTTETKKCTNEETENTNAIVYLVQCWFKIREGSPEEVRKTEEIPCERDKSLSLE